MADESTNKLYFGDNLHVLRTHIPDEVIDLIYLDPPWKKQKKYNILYEEPDGTASEAQVMAYADTWYWDELTERHFAYLVENASVALSDTMQGLRMFLDESDTMAYLVNMAIRLQELRRVLKPTGSIYLHCDPTAGHYLKVVMDSIFGESNFINEIVWSYISGGVSKRAFARKHDLVFFYAKDESRYEFEPLRIRKEKYEEIDEDECLHDEKGAFVWYIRPGTNPKKPNGVKTYIDGWMRDVWQIPIVNPQAKERLGYPTQKPEALLERIIQASSEEGDLVLDPFCGCGTTVTTAHKMRRNWIGIDITYLALDLIKSRLYHTFGDIEYDVIGLPTTVQGAERLATEDPFQFQYWALGLVDARPPGHTQTGKKGADRGIDGIKYIDEGRGDICKVILQVKSGHVEPSHIRDLKGTVDREGAQIGAFLTLNEPTRGMIQEAATAGFYHSDNLGRDYPKIQILTINDILKHGKRLKHPSRNITFRRPERAPDTPNATQLRLDDR